jgi:ABC-type multidrug transport system fused ATPase/permease subunit
MTALLSVNSDVAERDPSAQYSVSSNQYSVNGVEEVVLAGNPVYLKGEPPAPVQVVATAADQLKTLTVHGLTYAHDDHNGIYDIDLTLEQGQFVVITGRVGSGKTTLLRALLGLLPVQKGEVSWNGRLITNPADFFVPPRTAYTAQIPQLFSMTLRENVLMGLQEADVDLTAVFHQAVMEQDIAEMSGGLETIIGPKGYASPAVKSNERPPPVCLPASPHFLSLMIFPVPWM